MYKLFDKTDLKLLAELDKNSRQTISKIAKKLKGNQNTLQFRLKRLIDEQVIISFYPSIDISKLGLFAFRTYFNFTGTDATKEQKIINELVESNICTIVAELELNYSVMFITVVKNNKEFYNFWKQFKEKYGEYINDEQISFILKIEHFKRDYLINSKRNRVESVGESEIIKLDKEDKQILSLLAKNCRTSALDISDKTKIPARTVIYKIKQLEKKKIILGYRINIDLGKMGYEYFKLNIKLTDIKQMNNLNILCRQNNNVVYIDYTISPWDFELDLEIKNKQELFKFIKNLKSIFPIIKEIEIITFLKYYKIETIPKII